jgi:hypothetical protein
MPNNMCQSQKKSRPPRNCPMGQDARMVSYGGNRATRDGFTGPQRRRLTHKDNHANAPFEAEAGQETAA